MTRLLPGRRPAGAGFGQGDLAELDEKTLVAALPELPHLRVTELGQVVDLFAEVGLVASKSAARRTVKEGGAYVNNVKMTADAVIGAGKLLHGRWLLLRRGKENLAASRRPLRSPTSPLHRDERRAARDWGCPGLTDTDGLAIYAAA